VRWFSAFVLLATTTLLMAALARPASAHPLGNFTVNHLTYVTISSDRVDLHWILDQAEIPTFREQQQNLTTKEVLRRKLTELRYGMFLTVDGRLKKLHVVGSPKISFPTGQANLKTTRVEVDLAARVKRARNVEVRDNTYGSLLGFIDIVPRPGRGTVVRTTSAKTDPSRGLRAYKGVTLKNAPQQRLGRFKVREGNGRLIAPGPPPAAATEGSESGDSRNGDGFAGVFERFTAGDGFFLLLMLAAFGWGALHALSPGHGKAMVAAYLVGTQGTPKDAVALGGIVTVTHTIGVFALGLMTLFLTQFILPEDLYPWLNVLAGLLIVAVGLGILRSRTRWARDRGNTLSLEDQRDPHGHHSHGHHHHHHHTPQTTRRGLLGMGISAGLIPCPSALVVLLAAISQHRIAVGLVLILLFSLGLAATLTVLGLVVVHAKRTIVPRLARIPYSAQAMSVAPILSPILILGLGLIFTAKALPDAL
jgi:ABC-type nickel/cobalt efflux system permease component RcnA